MAHRQFTDSAGNVWDVWDVYPTAATRTLAEFYPRLQTAAPGADPCHAVAPSLAGGWLCFEQAEERRRLAPIPDAWDQLSGDRLEQLRDCATRVMRAEERQRRTDPQVPPQAQA